MLPTLAGLIAKIDGIWYSVQQAADNTISIQRTLTVAEQLEFDLIQAS